MGELKKKKKKKPIHPPKRHPNLSMGNAFLKHDTNPQGHRGES